MVKSSVANYDAEFGDDHADYGYHGDDDYYGRGDDDYGDYDDDYFCLVYRCRYYPRELYLMSVLVLRVL